LKRKVCLEAVCRGTGPNAPRHGSLAASPDARARLRSAPPVVVRIQHTDFPPPSQRSSRCFGGVQALLIPLLAIGALALVACGPVDFLSTVAIKATRAVAEAKAANAEKLAPYEYWSAVEYLHMAKEKAAYADYEIAIGYGDKAEQMGKEARRIASTKAQAGPGALPSGEEVPPTLAPDANKKGTNP
jgi:hypothetical protein